MEVQCIGRERILLLVVPPHTDADVAHEAMMSAAAPDNASTVGDLIAIGAHHSAGPSSGDRPTFRRRVRRFRQ